MGEDDSVRVLVVDDIPDVADAIAGLLKLDGYVVQTAYRGEEAVELAERFRPHCVLLDISMPGMDGLELTKLMRKRYGDDVVLIAMTGAGQDDHRVQDTFSRVDHYLAKPINSERLRKVLPPQ